MPNRKEADSLIPKSEVNAREREGEGGRITSSSTFNVRITAPAASSANATAKTSDWRL